MQDSDGIWYHHNEILGRDFDGINYTIKIPANKNSDMCNLMRRIQIKLRVALTEYQKLAGKIQHASLAMPSGRSLFTPLDMAMKGDPDFVSITPVLQQCLEDWRVMVQFMASNPTYVRQLVMAPSSYISYTYICKLGTGVVWCSGILRLKPLLWQV